MPNGFYGSKEEWERMVAPLRELDSDLESFAAAHGVEVEHNHHNTPNRMVRWTSNGIKRLMQISLYGGDKILFSLFAFRDADGKRYGKNWRPAPDMPLAEFKIKLTPMLTEAYRALEDVSIDDLEYWK